MDLVNLNVVKQRDCWVVSALLLLFALIKSQWTQLPLVVDNLIVKKDFVLL